MQNVFTKKRAGEIKRKENPEADTVRAKADSVREARMRK
jgi:hypothetical protein